MAALSSIKVDLAASLTGAAQPRRDAMLGQFGQLFAAVAHLLDDEGSETFDAIFVSLLPACSHSARIALSERLAISPKGPKRAVRHLAFDDAIAVARPVIRLSPLLLDEHLVALATVKSLDHLMAICERDRIDSSVTDVILLRANGMVRVALAANRGADFSLTGKTRLTEAARHDSRLRETLRERPELGLSGEDGAMSLEAQIVAGKAAPASDIEAEMDRSLRDLIEVNEVDMALGLLANIVGVPARAVAKAFALDVHGGFLAYAKAAPIDWQTTLRFIMKRYGEGHITPRLQRAEEDYFKLTISEARRITAMLAEHAAAPH